MLGSLNTEEKKLIDEYLSQKKQEGKSDEEIMREAGTKAMLFFSIFFCVFIFIIILAFIVLTGDEESFSKSAEDLVKIVKEFLYWNFPKLKGTSEESQL